MTLKNYDVVSWEIRIFYHAAVDFHFVTISCAADDTECKTHSHLSKKFRKG